MRATRIGCGAIALLFVFAGLAPIPVSEELRAQELGPGAARTGLLSREDALRDLQEWRELLLLVHPEPFAKVSQATFDKKWETLTSDLPASMPREDFFVRLAMLAALLRDSHTFVAPPSSPLGRLPVHVEADEVFLVEQVGSLPAGSRIERLEGEPIRDLLDRLRPLVGAETKRGQDAVMPRFLTLRTDHRFDDGVDLFGVSPFGMAAEATLAKKLLRARREPAVDAEFLEGNVMYLRVQTMAGPDPVLYGEWFDDLFRTMSEEDVAGLVIDLRGNAGGSTVVGDILLSYITDRPYRLFAEKRWRVSTVMQAQVRAHNPWMRSYVEAAPGEQLVLEAPLQEPAPRRFRFLGPTVVLIGPATGSAAMMTANAVRDLNLAVVLGHPTTTPPNFFGEVYRFTLPNSLLRGSISTAEFVRVSADPANSEPVQPHLEMPAMPELLAMEQDLTLVRAVAVIHALARPAGR
ncbi:MAG: S41 family peptidase [Myxococcota bacterium]